MSEMNKEHIGLMFDEIAPTYDFLNHFLSFGIDKTWRRKAIKILKNELKAHPSDKITILDIATGTADFAIAASRLNPLKITGIDVSEKMLEIGRKKIIREKLDDKIFLQREDVENLSFAESSFDVVIVAFGVRNFKNLRNGLSEISRVLQPGGIVLILEFSIPKKFPFRQLYSFYFNNILPSLGRLISKHKNAYTYLPESVSNFKQGEEFKSELTKLAFKEIKSCLLAFGIATIYTAKK
jgi:demethylmenaquinone methyltransferase / 2-methoxy-6-polyprenyl-1,4-benzoquinol methylase